MATKEKTSDVKIAKAKLAFTRQSPRKVRRTANLVRNMTAGEAVQQLEFSPYAAAPAIKKLSKQFLTDPVHISVTPANTTAEKVEQRVYLVNQAEKQSLLNVALLDEDVGRSLVFTRTKHGADRIVKRLAQVGIRAIAIHGNKSQGQRQRALEDYRSGKVNILIATDIAARGIDIPDITHVFNYEIPNVAEQYVHRIGRTARAKKSGIAVAFVDKSEQNYLRDIEKLLKQKLPQLDMPADMAEKLSALKSRKPLPPPEKPKPDPRKGRGKSKKKARFSRSNKANSEGSKHAELKQANTEKNHQRDKSKARVKTETGGKTAPSEKGNQKHTSKRPAKKWSQTQQAERTRSRKPSSDKAKTPSRTETQPQSEEGKKAQSYSGKAYRGKPNTRSNSKSGSNKMKPSRAKRKAARSASGKTQKKGHHPKR